MELRREATDVYRRAILDAAEKVFARGPYADAKVAEIAREAGMAAGTLYNYFGGKDEIFDSLVELRGQELTSQLDSVFATPAEPIARLEALVRASLTHIEEHLGIFVTFIQSGGTVRLAHEVAERRATEYLRPFERAVREAIVGEVLRRDLAPADQVAYLTGAMHGYVRSWVRAGGRRGLSGKAATIVDVFVRGAGAR